MTISRPVAAALSANEQFKLRYPKYLKGAVLVALALTALFVWLFPRYEPMPYRLRQKELVLIDPVIEPPVVDVPPPPATPRTWLPVEPVKGDVPEDPIEVPPLLPVPGPPPPPRYADEGFVASASPPVLTHHMKADYPEIARRSGLEGTVLVQVLVGRNGRVVRAEILQGVHPVLNRAALAAASQCRFTPARQRELPVAVWMAVPYRFRLH